MHVDGKVEISPETAEGSNIVFDMGTGKAQSYATSGRELTKLTPHERIRACRLRTFPKGMCQWIEQQGSSPVALFFCAS